MNIGARSLRHVSKANGTMPTRPFSNPYKKARDDIQCEIDKREFDEMIATKNESALDPVAFPMVSTGVLEDRGPTSCSTLINVCLMVVLSTHCKQDRFSFPNLPLSRTMVSL